MNNQKKEEMAVFIQRKYSEFEDKVKGLKPDIDFFLRNYDKLSEEHREGVRSIFHIFNIAFVNMDMPGQVRRKIESLQKNLQESYRLNNETYEKAFAFLVEPTEQNQRALQKHYNKLHNKGLLQKGGVHDFSGT